MRAARLLLIAGYVALVSCGSAAQRCRVAAGFQQDPYAREQALNRCEDVANREHTQQLYDQETQRQYASQRQELQRQDAIRTQQAHRERAQRAQEGRLIALRMERERRVDPRPPELGGTPAESVALCSQQRGEHAFQRDDHGGTMAICRIGGSAIYVAHASATAETFDSVTTFYEGAAIEDVRGRVERELGLATAVTVESGFRVWTWAGQVRDLQLTTYDAGVMFVVRVASDLR